nr:MAG TPA: hypothetical protein [Caudoviricetes sp.]
MYFCNNSLSDAISIKFVSFINGYSSYIPISPVFSDYCSINIFLY